MNRADELKRILADVYGINSVKELDDAIKKEAKIDISVLAGELTVSTQLQVREHEVCA